MPFASSRSQMPLNQSSQSASKDSLRPRALTGWVAWAKRGKKKELRQAKPHQKNASNKTKTRSQKNQKGKIWRKNDQKQEDPKEKQHFDLLQPAKPNTIASKMSFYKLQLKLKTNKIYPASKPNPNPHKKNRDIPFASSRLIQMQMNQSS